MTRYTTDGNESEILQNLLALTDQEAIHNAEFDGFLMAEIIFTEQLSPHTLYRKIHPEYPLHGIKAPLPVCRKIS